MSQRLHLNRACNVLSGGGVIAYPTEAVWGLGCEPLNAHACARLLALKRRNPRKGLILIAADFFQLEPYLADVDSRVLQRALDTWPGPSTWLLSANEGVPPWLRGDHDTLAVRVTAHPLAAELCREYGGAIVSTSANVAGRPPARSALQVRCCFGRDLDYLLPGELGGLDAPTPIRDLRTGKILRA